MLPGVVDEIKAEPAVSVSDSTDNEKDLDRDDVIIVTGADAAAHLLPMRDDHEPALTFRSIFLATGLSAFQAVMYQIYIFKPTMVTIQGKLFFCGCRSRLRVDHHPQAHSSSSSRTFSVKAGPPACLAATSTRLGGEQKAAKANSRSGSLP
jgi:hypothetical protein